MRNSAQTQETTARREEKTQSRKRKEEEQGKEEEDEEANSLHTFCFSVDGSSEKKTFLLFILLLPVLKERRKVREQKFFPFVDEAVYLPSPPQPKQPRTSACIAKASTCTRTYACLSVDYAMLRACRGRGCQPRDQAFQEAKVRCCSGDTG